MDFWIFYHRYANARCEGKGPECDPISVCEEDLETGWDHFFFFFRNDTVLYNLRDPGNNFELYPIDQVEQAYRDHIEDFMDIENSFSFDYEECIPNWSLTVNVDKNALLHTVLNNLNQ